MRRVGLVDENEGGGVLLFFAVWYFHTEQNVSLSSQQFERYQ